MIQNASDGGILTGGAGKQSLDHILRSMDSLHDFANIVGRCVADQSVRESGKLGIRAIAPRDFLAMLKTKP